MKKFILLFIITVSSNINAQFSENNSIYSSGEIDFGNYIGVNVNLNYIYKEKYSFQLGYSGHMGISKNRFFFFSDFYFYFFYFSNLLSSISYFPLFSIST